MDKIVADCSITQRDRSAKGVAQNCTTMASLEANSSCDADPNTGTGGNMDFEFKVQRRFVALDVVVKIR